MVALSERKLDIVRGLVEAAPDAVVEGLRQALATAGGDAALLTVRGLVERESADRGLRNAVLGPLAPMCSGDGADLLRLSFPAGTAGLIWRGLKAQAPALVSHAQIALHGQDTGKPATSRFDRLLRVAAECLRAGEAREFRKLSQLCDAARPDGAAMLAACLDIAPVVRGVSHRLSDWVTHPSAQATAAARVAHKDASAYGPEAACAFFHMLAAQLANRGHVLRIISAVMEKPTERYLADAGLSAFGEGLMRDVEQGMAAGRALTADAGVEAARDAARQTHRAISAASELETYLSLSREQGFGRTVHDRRVAFADLVAARCDEAEKFFHKAMPARAGGHGPLRLNAAPDEAAARRCRTLLVFVAELRASANPGGFAAARNRLLETLGEQLDPLVEDLLDALKTAAPEEAKHAQGYLAAAADFSAWVRDEKAAELVRRRAAAAAAPALADPVRAVRTGT